MPAFVVSGLPRIFYFHLAQAISMLEVLVAKFVGLALAIGAAIVFGIALSIITTSYLSGGEGIDVFPRLTVLTVLLG
jgi:ABC-type transport system involved in multi-copper enzyme maturation permease subunit